MTPQRRQNLLRLLRPRHIAVIGGADAETVVGECARIGFAGPVWPVNPKRREMGGRPCFVRIEDLPDPPDAVFLAINRDAAIDAVEELSRFGAGGAVCYTAGFAETGAEGAAAQARLAAAAGDLALIGPNCYGVVNFVDRVALWPFAHGGGCPGYGAAIITQSGMLSSDLTMSQRSVPFAFMISAGNQAILHLEDFVDVVADVPEVRAIGLHIEGLKNVAEFSEAALKALTRNVPIVALKTGASRVGARLTISHTGSLSGTDDLYQALFDRLGIIRVHSPAQMLETLKFLCVSGVPGGTRIAGFTCSGGGAAMLADRAEKIGLEFPDPADATARNLKKLLPRTATVSNPLDYTTPIWGLPNRTGPVFQEFLRDDCDAAVLVQDYPLAGLEESKQHYLNDAQSFIDATRARRVPAAVCSTLPENIDRETREMLVARGVAPLQGIHEALDAIAGASWFGRRRAEVLARRYHAPATPRLSGSNSDLLDEAEAKSRLSAAGLSVPEGRVSNQADAGIAAEQLGFPVALKMVGSRLPHKSEAGAVAIGLADRNCVETAVSRMCRDVDAYDSSANTGVFLVERMVDDPIAELMVNIRTDPQFGQVMTLATGGILVELIEDAQTLLLPADVDDMARALGRLKAAKLIDGYRGRPAAARDVVVGALKRLADYAAANAQQLVEVEINPLFVLPETVCAVDVLMQVAARAEAEAVSA